MGRKLGGRAASQRPCAHQCAQGGKPPPYIRAARPSQGTQHLWCRPFSCPCHEQDRHGSTSNHLPIPPRVSPILCLSPRFLLLMLSSTVRLGGLGRSQTAERPHKEAQTAALGQHRLCAHQGAHSVRFRSALTLAAGRLARRGGCPPKAQSPGDLPPLKEAYRLRVLLARARGESGT